MSSKNFCLVRHASNKLRIYCVWLSIGMSRSVPAAVWCCGYTCQLSYVRTIKLRDAKLTGILASARPVTPRTAQVIASRTRPVPGLSDRGEIRFWLCHDNLTRAIGTRRSARTLLLEFSEKASGRINLATFEIRVNGAGRVWKYGDIGVLLRL